MPALKIAIVEDEGLIAADLESRLATEGYAVPGIASCAETALELVERTSPDLVLMDIRLKGGDDGIDVGGQIQARWGVPIVYVTAHADPATIERASRSCPFGYIRKPINTAALKCAVEVAVARHAHERQIREQRDWALASFAALPLAVMVCDNFDRITYINQEAARLCGCTSEQILGRAAGEVFTAESQVGGVGIAQLNALARLNGGMLSLPSDLELAGLAGFRYRIAGSIAPRWRDGRLDGTLVVFADVTRACFETDQRIRDSCQQSALRMAEGVVRHLPDLGEVARQTALLVEGLPESSPLRSHSEQVERACLEAFATTCHLRRILKPPQVESRRVCLNELVDRLDDVCRTAREGFLLRVAARRMEIQGDSWQLLRALLNILRHARSHRKPGTPIDFDCGPAEWLQMPEWAAIRVAYTALRHDPDAVAHAFDFAWLNSSQDLHLAYDLVKSMGGLVNSSSEPGGKTSLEIYLPLVLDENLAPETFEGTRPTVLLIEPDSEIRSSLHRHFEEHGFNLLEASAAQEAVELAGMYSDSISLAIANLKGQDEEAGDLLAELSASHPETQVRVLVGYFDSPVDAGVAGSAILPLTKWDLLQWAQRQLTEAAGNPLPSHDRKRVVLPASAADRS